MFLAFLLLFTQQIGAAHVYSHWIDVAQSGAEFGSGEQSETRKRIAVHKVCAECVTVAQVSAALTSPAMTVAVVAIGGGVIATPATLTACERTVCVFQSRAPPLA
ncbi:hypothetical protein [Duganella sp. CF517]|uniref:hypothetical protein n=1 Tax=Duganella sp. CF517 TaxID=1881038 RepID=UPI0011605431|nr:hypothetical protein [Duganella sp. CF517]